jgi:hypothetical protein
MCAWALENAWAALCDWPEQLRLGADYPLCTQSEYPVTREVAEVVTAALAARASRRTGATVAECHISFSQAPAGELHPLFHVPAEGEPGDCLCSAAGLKAGDRRFPWPLSERLTLTRQCAEQISELASIVIATARDKLTHLATLRQAQARNLGVLARHIGSIRVGSAAALIVLWDEMGVGHDDTATTGGAAAEDGHGCGLATNGSLKQTRLALKHLQNAVTRAASNEWELVVAGLVALLRVPWQATAASERGKNLDHVTPKS